MESVESEEFVEQFSKAGACVVMESVEPEESVEQFSKAGALACVLPCRVCAAVKFSKAGAAQQERDD